jgi:hypothetical protein
VFQETADRENFQARYVLRHPWTGASICAAADSYNRALSQRREREAVTLASLTGWSIEEVRNKIGLTPAGPAAPAARWWERLWK